MSLEGGTLSSAYTIYSTVPFILLMNYFAGSPYFPATLNLSRIRYLSLEIHFNIIVQIDICVLDYCTIVLPLDLKAFVPICNLFSLTVSWDCHVKGPS